VADVADKRRTIFPTLEDGTPFFWNYQLKGFFKDSAKMLLQMTERREVEVVAKDGTKKTKKQSVAKNEAGKLMNAYNYKTRLDGLLFVLPRKLPIRFNGGLGDCQRPLRTDGMIPRTALASSDTVPAESVMEFRVGLMDEAYEAFVRECLDYGEVRGLGQWRNSGKGTFLWEELDEDGNVIGGNYEALKENYF